MHSAGCQASISGRREWWWRDGNARRRLGGRPLRPGVVVSRDAGTAGPHPRVGATSLLRRVEAAAHGRVEGAVVHASSVPADPACVALQVNYVVIFAAVYGLSDADIATIGVTATQLRHALGLSNVELGALASVATGVGALATLPAGILADRVNRVRLLAGAVALWAAAMVLSAFATSFPMLVGTRVLLGGLLAVAGPTTASLLGDVWPAADRGRIYGLITSGELIGAGVGFVLSGELAAVSWRLAFLALALPAAILAVRIRRLPEPKRTVRRIPTTTGTLGSDGSRARDGDPGIVCTMPALERRAANGVGVRFSGPARRRSGR